jgi:hypothetical protein
MILILKCRACFSEHFDMSYAFFRQADNLLCILQVLTLCSSFSEISRIKNSCGDFLHPGSLDPQRLTKGAEGSHARPWWRNGQGSPGHACTHGSPADHTGGDGGARGRTGRGPTGPEAHREGTCGAGLAGDGPAAAESGGGARASAEETASPAVIPATPRRFLRRGELGR